jgi:glycosyltransferase involved in cell wall biosynthesis/GT2 family glycosyltransferase
VPAGAGQVKPGAARNVSESVVIPVKDGERWLGRSLEALAAQGAAEVLVIDSGSRDGSVAVARAAGVELLEVDPADFGHARTRNLGAGRTSGSTVLFLTQDAVPEPGWLAAHREALALDPHVGASFGPHLAHPDTSPMIARELEEFFSLFAPNGRPAVQGGDQPVFLSNVNAAYRRDCLAELGGFPDVAYAEDQAFAQAMLGSGWVRAFHPGAAVRHAHDYGALEFMRRYFDEYRGLRGSTGHVEPFRPLSAGREVARDVRWMRERGYGPAARLRWGARSAVHHTGRRAFSALGSRADRLPDGAQRALSLERAAPPAPNGHPTRGRRIEGGAPAPFQEVLRVDRDGSAPLLEPVPGMADRERLHVAVVIPPFQRGSGGHGTIFRLVALLERMGHTCSIWVYDPLGRHASEWDAVLRRRVLEFAPVSAPVRRGFEHWHGADVAVATGWETAYPVVLLRSCRARAYLVNDHEPEFFATSAERLWAERTYSLGMFPISASPWLRDLLARRYGADGAWFALGVDERVYRPLPVERRRDTVVFYARGFTPRRAVPLGLLALEELGRRMPGLRVVAFGQDERIATAIPYELLGVADPEQLALTYSEGTVGLCLSMTNYSLIPQEMMACGMPCVDLASGSSESVFGADGPVELAPAEPVALADALEALLRDEARWRRRSQAGLEFVREASWDVAARQVEAGLREALRRRERA